MPPELTLRSGAMRCTIVPALGGSIGGLWLDGIAVLREPPLAGIASVREMGSYPLLPFSNRVGHASFEWDHTRYTLLPNFPPEPHAIHGVAWQRAWTVVQADAQSATLALAHAGDQGWPFAFDSVQEFRLSAAGLSLQMSASNRCPHAAPMGLGWHPYFAKRPHSHIRFRAAARWDMGDDKLPTQRRAAAGLDTDCAELDVDHCFDGWEGALQLRDEHLQTSIRSSVRHLVVFTHPSRNFVAIEPVSHVNNAIQLAADRGCALQDLGLRILQPGESLSADMHIGVQRTDQVR
ncbi:MAG: aldose 1-epimerase [Rhodoferax sp.]|nr:aldose 1-epimerase [Rhodoferax sp.]